MLEAQTVHIFLKKLILELLLGSTDKTGMRIAN